MAGWRPVRVSLSVAAQPREVAVPGAASNRHPMPMWHETGGHGCRRRARDRHASVTPPGHKPASVLILGSGPVVIGQAAEFDYAGTQACRALRAEGVRTILVNSNPATIMTDPDVADAIYLEPLTVEAVEAVIRSEERRVGKECCR